MTTVFDVAEYILKAVGPMSAMKLQKLVYYAQAWSTVWDDAPLFPNCIEAWANGPVVRDLYEAHRGKFTLSHGVFAGRGDADKLSEVQRDTVDAVIEAYAGKSAQWLSDQTHSEEPWRNARGGLADGERGQAEISLAALSEYFGRL